MQSDLVYDVGMNNGDDTAYYLQRGYRVVAIEADPFLAEAAAVRFSDAITDGRLTILNVAIAETNGTVPFYLCQYRDGWSSLFEDAAAVDSMPPLRIDVPGVTFDSVLETHGVPFGLKIDIQYADHFCLEALQRSTDLPHYLSFEWSTMSASRLPLVRSLGYDRFKLINQYFYLPVQSDPILQERRAALMLGLRRYFRTNSLLSRAAYKLGGGRLTEYWIAQFRTINGWRFSELSSGPFAEETPGDWRSYDQMMSDLDGVSVGLASDGLFGFWDAKNLVWIDIHARLAE